MSGVSRRDFLLGWIKKIKNNLQELTDLPDILKKVDKIINSEKDIQQLDCNSGWQDNKVGINKSPTVRAGNPFILGKTKTDLVRKLTPLECERL